MLIDTTPITAASRELRPLEVQEVRRTGDEPLFNSLVEHHHYLGYEQPAGEHLKYLVWSEARAIACLAWSSAPRHLGSRDRFIGWSQSARKRNIRFLAYNTRFLILPWTRAPHLASHILSRVTAALSCDWERLYGHPVWFAETFIDPERFRGTCYRAANVAGLRRVPDRARSQPIGEKDYQNLKIYANVSTDDRQTSRCRTTPYGIPPGNGGRSPAGVPGELRYARPRCEKGSLNSVALHHASIGSKPVGIAFAKALAVKCRIFSTHSSAFILPAVFLPLLSAQTPSRAPVTIQTEPRFTLSRNTPPRIASATDLGPVDDSFMLPHITMHFRLTDAQQQQLDQLVRDQQDRASANYHKWLTPDEFGRRFGLSDEDLAAVRSWLESQGFTAIDAAPGRNMMTFRGTAGQVRGAFGTAIHRYRTGNELHFSNSSDPELPAGLGGVVQALLGLDDFRPRPALATPNNGNLVAPTDLAVLYDLQPAFAQGVNGAGQTIAIAGASALSDLDLGQIQTFRTLSGLPPLDLQIVPGPRPPGVEAQSGWELEAMLDIEWSGAAAPGASILFVNADTAVDAMFYAIQENLAPVLSVSYVWCEPEAGEPYVDMMASYAQQGNAQGITILASAGDAGPAGCDFGNDTSTKGTLGFAVSAPSSAPSVTAVGGTQFNEGAGTYWSSTNSAVGGSVLSYIPELPWNEVYPNGAIGSGGGGSSIFFSKPAWQQGLNVPNDGRRDVPDVSLSAAAHDGYVLCAPVYLTAQEVPSCTDGFVSRGMAANGGGGTSASAPIFAGMVTLLNQVYGRQGNINPELYQLASFSPDAFHDVTTGEITAACKPGTTDCPANGLLSLAAGPGYDLATGLGSIDAFHFVEEWASDFQLSEARPAMMRRPPASPIATDIAVDAIGHFPGTIYFTCAIEPAAPGWQCTVSGPVQSSGNVRVGVERTADESASPAILPEPVTVFVTGTSGLLSHTISVLVPSSPSTRTGSAR